MYWQRIVLIIIIIPVQSTVWPRMSETDHWPRDGDLTYRPRCEGLLVSRAAALYKLETVYTNSRNFPEKFLHCGPRFSFLKTNTVGEERAGENGKPEGKNPCKGAQYPQSRTLCTIHESKTDHLRKNIFSKIFKNFQGKNHHKFMILVTPGRIYRSLQ